MTENIIAIRILKAIKEVFGQLNILPRWTEFTHEPRFNEGNKQALNCIVCYLLASEAERQGEKIRWELFPKIVIYREFKKANVNFDIPEKKFKEIFAIGNMDYTDPLDKVTVDIITELSSQAFAEFLQEIFNTYEEKLYKAATKIATLLELIEINSIVDWNYNSKYEEIFSEMQEFKSIKGFKELSDPEGEYFKFFKSISKLRNQNRWVAYYCKVDCSVLGHLLDTAVFAYFMALEKGLSEKEASKCFFMGIFHDVPEAYTKDMPSPIKDRIPGLRKLTEIYELNKMEEKVFSILPKTATNAIKKVMFEEEENNSYKKLMKGADYLSAISEIWRQVQAGSRDIHLYEAMYRHVNYFKKGIAECGPISEQLIWEMISFAKANEPKTVNEQFIKETIKIMGPIN